jgi:hypothetical protein
MSFTNERFRDFLNELEAQTQRRRRPVQKLQPTRRIFNCYPGRIAMNSRHSTLEQNKIEEKVD